MFVKTRTTQATVLLCIVVARGIAGDNHNITASSGFKKGASSVECALDRTTKMANFSKGAGTITDIHSEAVVLAERDEDENETIMIAAKACWCTEKYQYPLHYCPAHFDSCVVRQDDPVVKCYQVSKSQSFLRGFWPFVLFWYGLLFMAFFCSYRGVDARAHLKRKLRNWIAHTEENDLRETVNQWIEEESWLKIAHCRQKAIIRRSLTAHFHAVGSVYALIATWFFDDAQDDPEIDEVLRDDIRPRMQRTSYLALKLKKFHTDDQTTLHRSLNVAGGDDAVVRQSVKGELCDGNAPVKEVICINDNCVSSKGPDRGDIENEDEQSGETCAICLKRFNEGDCIGDISCGHFFHKACLKDWLARKNSCPLCQQKDIADLIEVVETVDKKSHTESEMMRDEFEGGSDESEAR